MIHSDMFILYPVFTIPGGKVIENNDLEDAYCIELHNTSLYECNKEFASTITRHKVGDIKVSYMSDEYEASGIEWIDAKCYLTYQKKSELGIITINIPSCSKDDTQIGDIVFSGHLQIKIGKQELPVEEYISSLGMQRCGKVRIMTCNSRDNRNEEEIGYLLAGETAGSEHIDYKIRDEKIRELTANNIAMYDFYDLYASSRCIVYLIDGFDDNYRENLDEEALLLYICEIAVLQNAAIGRINAQIVDELMMNSNISTKKTLKLQVEFGKTILLWDNKIYNYYMSQQLSNNIVQAFETDKLLEEYERNSKHIEQIASLKSAISSDIEGKILNVLAFVLSIGQIIQLAVAAVNYFGGQSVFIGASGISVTLLLLICIAIIRRRRA